MIYTKKMGNCEPSQINIVCNYEQLAG